jgi:alpha-ketoglutarate-dependent taurine dioxygenase
LSNTTKMTLVEVQSTLGFPGASWNATFQRTATIGNNQVPFPGVIKPIECGVFRKQLELIKATSRDEIVGLLQKHGGAIVLRGFGPSSAQDFSDLAHALRLGPHPHQEVGRPPRRTVLAKGVSTANEGPPDSPIWVHNEYGWSTIYPSYVLFFALRAPDIGTSAL